MHSPTLLIAVLINAALMTGVLFLTWKFNSGIQGLREWFLGFLAALVNISLFLLNPPLLQPLSPLVLQALLLCTGAMALVGTFRHLERPRIPSGPILACAAIALVASAGTSLSGRNPTLVFGLGSVATGLYFLAAGVVLARAGTRPHPARRLCLLLMLVHGIFMLARPLLLTQGALHPVLSQVGWNGAQLILVEQLIMTSAFGLCIVLLANEKNARELRLLAEQDSLTNLFNRRAFLKSLQQACSFSERRRLPLAILMIDVDHFKQINDLHGHDVGDTVLKSLCALITRCLRTEDVMGRMGGEEFAIYLPSTRLDAALVVAERIREKVHATPIPIGSGHAACSVSIGVTVLGDREPLRETLRRGDQAMYFAKSNGRNRVEFALPPAKPQDDTVAGDMRDTVDSRAAAKAAGHPNPEHAP